MPQISQKKQAKIDALVKNLLRKLEVHAARIATMINVETRAIAAKEANEIKQHAIQITIATSEAIKAILIGQDPLVGNSQHEQQFSSQEAERKVYVIIRGSKMMSVVNKIDRAIAEIQRNQTAPNYKGAATMGSTEKTASKKSGGSSSNSNSAEAPEEKANSDPSKSQQKPIAAHKNTQRDAILVLDFRADIGTKKLNNISSQADVDHFDVRSSVQDISSALSATSKKYKKIIIMAHGMTSGTRKTESEKHRISIGTNVPLPSNIRRESSMTMVHVKTEDLINYLINMHSDVDEIILDSCYASSIRAITRKKTERVYAITALSSAKHKSITVISEACIIEKLKHYERLKDPYAALGWFSVECPTTITLITNDNAQKKWMEFKLMPPKHKDDIENLAKFLLNEEPVVYMPASSGKPHQRHNIQFRNISKLQDMSLVSQGLAKIIAAKKEHAEAEWIFSKDHLKQYTISAMYLSAFSGNFKRATQYFESYRKRFHSNPMGIGGLLYVALETTRPLAGHLKIVKNIIDLMENKDGSGAFDLRVYSLLTSCKNPAQHPKTFFEEMFANIVSSINREDSISLHNAEHFLNKIGRNLYQNFSPENALEYYTDLSQNTNNTALSAKYKGMAGMLRDGFNENNIELYKQFFVGLRNCDTKVFWNLAEAYAKSRNFKRANQYCERATQNDPEPGLAHSRAVRILRDNSELATAYIEKYIVQKDPEKAAGLYCSVAEKVIKSDPAKASGYYKRAIELSSDIEKKAEYSIKMILCGIDAQESKDYTPVIKYIGELDTKYPSLSKEFYENIQMDSIIVNPAIEYLLIKKIAEKETDVDYKIGLLQEAAENILSSLEDDAEEILSTEHKKDVLQKAAECANEIEQLESGHDFVSKIRSSIEKIDRRFFDDRSRSNHTTRIVEAKKPSKGKGQSL